MSEVKNKNKLLSLVNNYIGLNIPSEIESMSGIRATFLWTLENWDTLKKQKQKVDKQTSPYGRRGQGWGQGQGYPGEQV